jgi:uncharacterized glyoxalase superfamily protein PhnB
MATAKKKATKTARGNGRVKTKKASASATGRKSARPRTPAKASRQERKSPETLRMRSVSPSFTVNDIEKSVAWYRDVMGFVEQKRWEDDGKLLGVEMLAGSVVVMLGQDDWKKGRDRVKGEGFRIYCDTAQDVDRLAARVEASGGRVTQQPTDQPWGMRDFSVEDPDGFKISIGAPAKR